MSELEPTIITETDLLRAGDLAPQDVRRAGDWSRSFDGIGEQEVSDMAGLREASFGVSDTGVLFLRGYCCHCSRSMRLPLEGAFADPDSTEPVALERRMLSLMALVFAQRMACVECRARLEAEEERKERTERYGLRLRESMLPPAMAGVVSWESLIVKGRTEEETSKRAAAIEACKAWAEKKKPARGILLWGPAGSGKTRLAATAAAARLEHSPIRWVSVAVLMAELEASFADEDRRRALKVVTGKSVVVFDDVDKVKSNQAVRSQLFAALDKREQAKTPVVVTTNLSPSELADELGTVFASRLMGMCTAYPYPGMDQRLEIGES